MILNVYSTKTIQFKERRLEILIFTVSTSPLCAVTLLKRHWDMFPAPPDSPLFRKPARDGSTILLYSNVLGVLKKLVRNIGLDGDLCGAPLTSSKWRHLPVQDRDTIK